MQKKPPFFLEIRFDEANFDSKIAYDDLYEETGLSQIQSFYLWLMEQLRLPKQGRLLDVSCGAGEVVKLAGEHGLKAVGVDISEVVAHTAQEKINKQGWISVSTGENLPFPDEYFNFVTNIGSLEHFFNPAQGVSEMARVLHPEGKTFILLPNTFSLLTNILVAFRTGETSIDDQPIQRYGARGDWTRLLEQNGLKITRTIKYERPFPRVLKDWGYYLRRPKELLRLFVGPFIPLNLAFCFLFICDKK